MELESAEYHATVRLSLSRQKRLEDTRSYSVDYLPGEVIRPWHSRRARRNESFAERRPRPLPPEGGNGAPPAPTNP